MNVWLIWIKLFCGTLGAAIVPISTAPLRELRWGVIRTATVDGGASAVETSPGACAIGLVIVLAPMLSTVAVTPSVPPHAARGPAVPLGIVRSGSENPSDEIVSRSRDSSRSRLSRLVRRRTRRSGRTDRESLGNTEHLPAADDPGRPSRKRRLRPIPDRELGWIRKKADREPDRSAGAARRCGRVSGNLWSIQSSAARPKLAPISKILTHPGLVVKGVTSTSEVGFAPAVPVGSRGPMGR